MSFPLSPTNGQTAVVNGITYQYSSTTTAWSRVPQSYSRTTTSTVAPVNPTPVAGDQWYNPTTDTLYRYTFDGAASYWVDITGASSTTTVGQAQTYLGETTAYGNITPTTNAAYNLGSTSRTFANIYVANGVFYANGVSTAPSYTTSATAPTNPPIGSQWYNTTTDIIYEYITDGVGTYWVDVSSDIGSNAVTGNVSLTANLVLASNVNILWANGTVFSSGITLANISSTVGNIFVSSHITPTANITYDLGTPTQRFRSLYLSGNTIDLGGAVIKSDATSGLVAFIPVPTANVPNPIATLISPSGAITTANTTGGILSPTVFSTTANSYSVTCALVGGGGGGGGGESNPGGDGAGGGGGGGILMTATTVTPGVAYAVIVGAGGVGGQTGPNGTVNAPGGNGGNSTFNGLTAIGGGGGGDGNGGIPTWGGSGGGAGNDYGASHPGGGGIYLQGQAGGDAITSNTNWRAGSGGGGAGGTGFARTGSGAAGNGGNPVYIGLSGVASYYAGGGGGGVSNTGGTAGVGSNGVVSNGGNGATSTVAPTTGTANTGTGGGGGVGQNVATTYYYGAAGGSGVVIITYASANQLGTGGTVTNWTNWYGVKYWVHTFNSSGTYTA